MTRTVDLGYEPLLDPAPLILAEELDFAAEERLHFRFHPARSWSQLRDIPAFGQVDAARMLSVVPVASERCGARFRGADGDVALRTGLPH